MLFSPTFPTLPSIFFLNFRIEEKAKLVTLAFTISKNDTATIKQFCFKGRAVTRRRPCQFFSKLILLHVFLKHGTHNDDSCQSSRANGLVVTLVLKKAQVRTGNEDSLLVFTPNTDSNLFFLWQL